MKTNLKALFLVFAISLFDNANADNEKQEVKIAVAANLSFVIKDIIKEFNQENPDIEIKTVIGASGKITAQIINGAPFEVFLSADTSYPEILWEKQIAVEQPKVYAKGLLILFSRNSQDFKNGLSILTNNQFRIIAIPNVKLAPYGDAACESLKKEKLYDRLKSKFIYGQNIAQTVQYALTAVDAAFISKSAIFAPQMKKYNEENKFWTAVDPNLYKPIEQAAVLISKREAAQRFYGFLFSKKAKVIFQNSGYEI